MEVPPIDDSGYAEEEYYYNYQGQRTMKKNSAAWTEYFYSGTAVKQYTYDEFGNKTESGTLLNEITFTGAVSDSNTGLYYMNADRL